MHDTHWLLLLHRLGAGCVPGARLHLLALEAFAAGRLDAAERLIDAAVGAYRRETAVEALARLRVHELMIRARRPEAAGRESEYMQEIVRRVNRLDSLESLTAPYMREDARLVLARWVGELPAAAPVGAGPAVGSALAMPRTQAA